MYSYSEASHAFIVARSRSLSLSNLVIMCMAGGCASCAQGALCAMTPPRWRTSVANAPVTNGRHFRSAECVICINEDFSLSEQHERVVNQTVIINNHFTLSLTNINEDTTFPFFSDWRRTKRVWARRLEFAICSTVYTWTSNSDWCNVAVFQTQKCSVY